MSVFNGLPPTVRSLDTQNEEVEIAFVRGALGKYRDGLKSRRACVYSAEFDLETLCWTRGNNFPLSRLESRMRCPACGVRDVTLMFIPPAGGARVKEGLD